MTQSQYVNRSMNREIEIKSKRSVTKIAHRKTATDANINPPFIIKNFRESFVEYKRSADCLPLFMNGDALQILIDLPDESVDFCMTSPPYWGQREYDNGGIGLEIHHQDFIKNLSLIFLQIKRVLKSTGSFWLNMGDSYHNKSLVGSPWRLAFDLIDNQGWILRNSVIWNKIKGGMDNSKDRLGNAHENVFHFVKSAKGYFYDTDAIRANPRKAKVTEGNVTTGTGVSGVRYKRQIELSTHLTKKEKSNAFSALQDVLKDVGEGKISDFRMIIRGQQRVTHSSSEKISGRAKELREKGFYFLKYHPKGSKPNDVWDILPEDTQKRETHFAPYPIELCLIPILATCPKGGVVIDPFCGTGTTMLAAMKLGRKSVGMDISKKYLTLSIDRIKALNEK